MFWASCLSVGPFFLVVGSWRAVQEAEVWAQDLQARRSYFPHRYSSVIPKSSLTWWSGWPFRKNHPNLWGLAATQACADQHSSSKELWPSLLATVPPTAPLLSRSDSTPVPLLCLAFLCMHSGPMHRARPPCSALLHCLTQL